MAPSASKVFISYNRADRDWAEWIAGVIKRAGYEPILDVWHFRPGENFVLRMHEAAMEANLTLAVLSEGYLQAAYTQPEWAAAFAPDPTGKDRRLIPVRVSKCTPTGILRSILYIDLIELNEQNAQQALLNGLKPSGEPAQPPKFPGERKKPIAASAPFPPNLALLHGVPQLPPHYLPRETNLAGLKQKLLVGDGNVGITGQSSAVGFAREWAALARPCWLRLWHTIQRCGWCFPMGSIWLTIGQKPNLLDLQNRLLRQLTSSTQTLTTEQEAKDALRKAMGAVPCWPRIMGKPCSCGTSRAAKHCASSKAIPVGSMPWR